MATAYVCPGSDFGAAGRDQHGIHDLHSGTLVPEGCLPAERGATFSLYLFAGALGAAVGPRLAACWGARILMFLSLLFLAPLFWAFGHAEGLLSFLLLGLAGATLFSSVPLNVALGQELLPEQAGTVPALMMRFAWGIGGSAATFVGALADRLGIATAMKLVACVPFTAMLLVPIVPLARQQRKR